MENTTCNPAPLPSDTYLRIPTHICTHKLTHTLTYITYMYTQFTCACTLTCLHCIDMYTHPQPDAHEHCIYRHVHTCTCLYMSSGMGVWWVPGGREYEISKCCAVPCHGGGMRCPNARNYNAPTQKMGWRPYVGSLGGGGGASEMDFQNSKITISRKTAKFFPCTSNGVALQARIPFALGTQ